MSCIQSATLNFVLFYLALASQQATAAEVANLPILININNSDYSSEMPLASSTDPIVENAIRRLLELYEDARLAGTAEEADLLAKKIVELSIRSYGRDSQGTARALTNLATWQSDNGENIAAIQNLTAAIDIVERVDNHLSMDLIYPLNVMGELQIQAGRIDLAQVAWSRAVHISHVNLGPHNFEQVESLLAIADLLSASGKNRKAKKMRRRIRELLSRDTDLLSEGNLTAVYE